MRIVCRKFKDYYDGVQGMGQDRTLVYVREPKEVDFPTGYPFPTFSHWGRRYTYGTIPTEDIGIDNYTIGFCGQLYPCIRLQKAGAEKFCYNIADVDEFVQAHFKDKLVEEFLSKPTHSRHTRWPWDCHHSHFEKFFNEWTQRIAERNQERIRKHFEDNHCPLFLGYSDGHYDKRSSIVTYNARLKDVEFFRIFDSYRAFQEISMYLGNIAEPRKPIPDIPDDTMAEIKGFDKFSFRKEPSKKR